MIAIQRRHSFDKSCHLPSAYMENKLKRHFWSKEETFKLIELYKKFPVLWDSKSENYKNRVLVKGALEAIADVFDTSSDKIRKKLQNLHIQFCQEVKKIKKRKNSLSSKGIYHCKWEYFQALQFTRWASRLKDDGETSKSNYEDQKDVEIEVHVKDQAPDIEKPFKRKKAHKKKNSELKSRKRKKNFPVEHQELVTSVNTGASTSKNADSTVDLKIQDEASSCANNVHIQTCSTSEIQAHRALGNNMSSPATVNAILKTIEEWQQCENATSKNNVGQIPDRTTLAVAGAQLVEETQDEQDKKMFCNRNGISSIGPAETVSYASSNYKADDESQDFGNLMARKLRKYDGVTQSAIQNAIMGVFLNADLGIYEQARNSLSESSTAQRPSLSSSIDQLRHAQTMFSSTVD